MAALVELYLIRHAPAEERGAAWPDDSRRPLSEDGVERMRKAARGLVRLGATFDIVLASPLLRARQTADIVARAFETPPTIKLAGSLAPGASYAMFAADLEKHARWTRIALVGHEPDLGHLAARLVGARRAFEFKKGAVCRIDVASIPPSGSGALRWFLTPAMLRAVRA
jgi:phosphohistidine phosphatase